MHAVTREVRTVTREYRACRGNLIDSTCTVSTLCQHASFQSIRQATLSANVNTEHFVTQEARFWHEIQLHIGHSHFLGPPRLFPMKLKPNTTCESEYAACHWPGILSRAREPRSAKWSLVLQIVSSSFNQSGVISI